MAATEAKAGGVGESDAYEQIRELREQVEALMNDRIKPAVSDAIGRAGDAVKHVNDMAHDQSDALAKQVREKPLTSLLIAAAAGYLLGRITR
jgi:ElaB/YqjD/DUF883 family membrane-anchored ribosome-binding protein